MIVQVMARSGSWLVVACALLAGACQGVIENPSGAEDDISRSGDDAPLRAGREFRCEPNASPAPPLIRRLTREEYISRVRSLTGVDLTDAARELFPPDPPSVEGFSNLATGLNVQYEHVLAYSELAQQAVQGIDDVSAFVSRYASCRDPVGECGRELVDALGFEAFGGALRPEEREPLVRLFDDAQERGQGFEEGAMDVVAALLQSPRFVYHHEAEKGDAPARELDSFELARRLAFLLWGGPPDQQLLLAAKSDELRTDAQLEAQVDRMLADPRARGAGHRFMRDWLDLDALREMSRDPAEFQGWQPELANQMRNETLAVFDELVWGRDASIMRLYDADFTVVEPELASFYGLPAPRDDGLVDLDGIPERGGLFTHGGLLALTGGPDASSVKRGLFFSSVVMCGAEIAEPPADVDTSQPPPEEGRSKRDWSEERVNDGRCGTCHASFEPPVWGLIPFDATGTYSQTDEAGNEIPTDGYINFVTGETATYEGPKELGRVLAQSERVLECMILNMSTYALGRTLTQADSCSLAEIRDRYLESDRTYRELMLAIVLSPMFQTVSTTQPEGEP